MVRQLTDDRLSVTWTDTEVRTSLNESMRYIARQVVKHQGVYNYANGSVTITTDGTNRTFATSQPSFYKFWEVVRTDTPTQEPVTIIDSRDASQYTTGSGLDGAGYVLAYFEINTSGDVIMGFPVVHASGLTFQLEFSVRPSKLSASGTGDASNTFTLLAEDWHELVCVDAAERLAMGNEAIIQDIRTRKLELMDDMRTALGQRKATPVKQTRPWNRMYPG